MTRLVVFDFETTSADPATARAVQLAAIEAVVGSDGPEVRELLNVLCNPGVQIKDEAAQVHGISADMVKDQPSDVYQVARFVLQHLRELGADETILAGHNSLNFDWPILRRLASEACKMSDDPRHHPVLPATVPHLDTLIMATRLWPEAPCHKLSQTAAEAKAIGKPGKLGLTQWLKLGDGENAHDALADVKMVLDLIMHICKVTGWDLYALADWCSKPQVLEICHIGKHQGKKWGRGQGAVPFSYAKWMCENWKDASLDMQATMLYHYNLRFQFPGALKTLEGCITP